MKRSLAEMAAILVLLHGTWVASARGYILNRTIGSSGGCPQLNRFDTSSPASKRIDRRWSTSASPRIQTTTGAWTQGNPQQQNEIEQSILRSFSVWTGVTGTTLQPVVFDALQRTSTQAACNSFDARNSICFNQTHTAFTGGILAFTIVLSAEAVNVGEILDADIYFKPNDAGVTFATPGALTTSHFDLESVMTHELGHFFGFSHSAVWRAMMWPFVPPKGQFRGDRPSLPAPDAPLADDDRVGLRVLYPDASDTVNIGRISGRILPANPIALATEQPPSPGRAVSGIFGTHVVAVDADTGQVVAGTLGGWVCDPADLPTRFDGSYALERLPVGRNYKLYVEPLDGPTRPSNVSTLEPLNEQICRAQTNNACTPPVVNTSFVTRVRP